MSNITINYDNSTQEQKDFIKKMIDRDLCANQSSLVNDLLVKEFFNYEDIVNLYNENKESQEIMQWFSLNDNWIAEELEKALEPVLKNEYGTWWGRTCFGQSVELDQVFWVIYQDALKK